jgi:hypothetical protein
MVWLKRAYLGGESVIILKIVLYEYQFNCIIKLQSFEKTERKCLARWLAEWVPLVAFSHGFFLVIQPLKTSRVWGKAPAVGLHFYFGVYQAPLFRSCKYRTHLEKFKEFSRALRRFSRHVFINSFGHFFSVSIPPRQYMCVDKMKKVKAQ